LAGYIPWYLAGAETQHIGEIAGSAPVHRGSDLPMSIEFSDDLDVYRNPLDALETIVSSNEWPFERNGDTEMAFAIGGGYSQYHLWFGWQEQAASLHLRCGYDFTVPDRQFRDICEVLARINEDMGFGFFDISTTEQVINFRYTVMAGTQSVEPTVLEHLVETALGACEKFYPAFMLALWGGKSPTEAVEAAMLETVGEA